MRAARPLTLLICIFLCIFLAGCIKPQPSEEAEKIPAITFEGRRYSYYGGSTDIECRDDMLIIKRSGSYKLCGELTEGRIYVDPEDGGSVTLCLSSAELASSYGSVIYSTCPMTVVSEKGTVNRLQSKNAPAVRTGGRLSFLGEGLTVINSSSSHGIFGGTDVCLLSGKLSVNSSECGVFARDGFYLFGGSLTIGDSRIGITAGDGEHSQGKIEISGGSLTAICSETVLSAKNEITVSGGKASLDCEKPYKCENGKISIDTDNFPKYRADE